MAAAAPDQIKSYRPAEAKTLQPIPDNGGFVIGAMRVWTSEG